jgi:hypothetical protein
VSFTVSLGATSVVLPDPRYGNGDEITRQQTMGTTSSGRTVVYDRGAAARELTFTWDNLDRIQASALDAFFENTAKAALNPIDLEWDDWVPSVFGGTAGTITKNGWIFATPRLTFVERRSGLFQVTIVFRDK